MSTPIEKEIEQVAGTLEKAVAPSPREKLFETIFKLGPAGIRAKLPTLEKAERELLVSVLQEMKKAVEMDPNYAAKYVQGNINDTKIQEDKGDDNQDEKLVKPEAAKFDHQGTPTPGWEGQVIKSMAESDEKAEKFSDAEIEGFAKTYGTAEYEGLDVEKAYEGFDKLKNKLSHEKNGPSDPGAVAAAIGRKKYGKQAFQSAAARGKKMKKGEEDKKENAMSKSETLEKKMGVPAGVNPEKHERCVRDVKKDGKGKNPYAICNASMKKGEIDDETRAALLQIRKSIEQQLVQMGQEPKPELVKSEMKRLLAEEDQDGDAPEMNEKTRANKPNVDALNHGKDNKEAQDKVNNLDQGGLKKTVQWGGQNDLLRANTFGRNCHFSFEGYVNEVVKAVVDAAKPQEDLRKSETPKKDDLNDIIAKSEDATWDDVDCKRRLEENNAKVKGRFTKSFEDNEIAEALGLTPEEAKKILGEK